MVEVADDGIETGRGQRSHVENTPNPGASAPDGASAAQGTAVPVEGRHAHQGRDLPSVQSAQLGQVGQQSERELLPYAGNGAQQVVLLTPYWTSAKRLP